MREVIPVKEWYHHQHSNLTLLDGLRSKWYMWNTAMEVVRKSIQQIQNYLYSIDAGEFIHKHVLIVHNVAIPKT